MTQRPDWLLVADETNVLDRQLLLWLGFPGADQGRLYQLAADVAQWASPGDLGDVPSVDPNAASFYSAARSKEKRGRQGRTYRRWNACMEPKWIGLLQALRDEPERMAKTSAVRDLLSPLARLLDFLRGRVQRILVLDRPRSGLGDPIEAARCVDAVLGRLSDPEGRRLAEVQVFADVSPEQPLMRDRLARRGRRKTQRGLMAVACRDSPLQCVEELERRVMAGALVAAARGSLDAFVGGLERGIADERLLRRVRRGLPGLEAELDTMSETGLDVLELLSTWLPTLPGSPKSPPSSAAVTAFRQFAKTFEYGHEPEVRIDGPHPIVPELSPIMLAADFLAGLVAFGAYGRRAVGRPGRAGRTRLGWKDIRGLTKVLGLTSSGNGFDLESRLELSQPVVWLRTDELDPEPLRGA